MWRTFFVFILIVFGSYYALQSAFFSLLFYIGNAYFRPDAWVWGDTIAQLHLSLISGCFVMFSTIATGQRLVFDGRTGLLFFFLYYTFLSILFANNFGVSFAEWIEFCKIVLISYLIVVLATDFSKLRLLLLVMSLAIGIEGAKQGWMYMITRPEWGANPNKLPFLGDNNDVAVGMFMMVPIVIALARTTQQRWAQWGYWILTIGLIGRALTTYSRGAFLTGMALAGLYWLRSQQKLRGLIGLLIALAFILPALPQEYWERMETISTYEEQEETSALSRFHFWQVAVDMANTYPIFGVGYMGYMEAYNSFDTSKGKYGFSRATHSAYFQVLGELGYVGFVLYALVFFSAFRACSRVRQHVRHAPHDSSLWALDQTALALQNSLCALLIGALFLSFAYKEIVWHFIGLTIAVERIALQAVTAHDRQEDTSIDTQDDDEAGWGQTQDEEPVYLGSRLFS